MGYEKIVKNSKEFAGESFSESISKNSGSVWNVNETATYSMYDKNGAISGVTGVLVTSDDKKSIGFTIPKTDTVALLGHHKVLVELGDSEDVNISDVIAEYNIEYLARKA